MKELLRRLCALPVVSGDEPAFRAEMEALLSPLGEVRMLPSGTALCFLPGGSDRQPLVLLEAHLDRIGLMVTRISEKGFVHAAAVGGIDPRTLAAARVTLHTRAGGIAGVVCAVPPHLSGGSDALPETSDVAIDVGMTAERARAAVRYGDRITLDAPFTELLGDRLASPALDDRAGCAAVLEAARLLKDCRTARVAVALSAQEETAGGGAATAANAVKPDFCFASDVTFGETPDSDPSEVLKIGGGPAIGIAPCLSRRLGERIAGIAEKNGIPFQWAVMAGRTSTDADAIACAGSGVATALLSIPERYMHTASEVISLADAENTAKLMALTIGGGLL